MKKALLSLLVAAAMLIPAGAKGASVEEAVTFAPPTAVQFQQGAANSTLAVYRGEQKCAWQQEAVFIFTVNVWKCSFVENFTCTATVISHFDDDYLAVTAGHCFDWKEEDRYYVAESTIGKPAMRKVKIVKFENDERYDYGLISFSSTREYASTPFDKVGEAPAVGTPIVNVNFSYGIVKQFTEGKVVSELIKGDAGGSCPICKGRYFVSIGLGPGASGSAVIDSQTGEIVGLAEAIFPDTQMPTLVIPMGRNFVDFMEDDSAGIRPLPEGPLPKEGTPGAPLSESKLSRIVDKFLFFFLFVI
jgi:hypothetical protein